MENTVISKFSIFYFAKFIGIGIVNELLVGYFIYYIIKGSEMDNLINIILILLLCLFLLTAYSYLFLKTFNKITVTSEHILIKHYITNRRLNISYDDITSIRTYGENYDDRLHGFVEKQNLVIFLANGKSVDLDTGQYNNYNELKRAIYKYKWGIA